MEYWIRSGAKRAIPLDRKWQKVALWYDIVDFDKVAVLA
jgi:hypothetical protein